MSHKNNREGRCTIVKGIDVVDGAFLFTVSAGGGGGGRA